MSKSKTELGVKVGYASIGNGTSEATLHLTGDATVDGIQTALKVIREELDFVTEVTSTVCEDAAYLRVRAAEQYSHARGYTYFDDDRRAKLVELVKPECTRKVTAAAAVKRPDGFKHTGTLVTLTLSEGDSFAKVNVRGLEKIDGVVRARKSGDSRIVFSMAAPAANDEDGKITEVVDAVAKKLDAQVTRPIAVTDDNADAALDPANDYVAPSTKAAAAS